MQMFALPSVRVRQEIPSNFLDMPFPLAYAVSMITTITDKNQVTLPTEIVHALDLKPGTQLEWSIGPDGTLIVTPQIRRAQKVAALFGAGRKYLQPGSDPIRGLIAERLQEDM